MHKSKSNLFTDSTCTVIVSFNGGSDLSGNEGGEVFQLPSNKEIAKPN